MSKSRITKEENIASGAALAEASKKRAVRGTLEKQPASEKQEKITALSQDEKALLAKLEKEYEETKAASEQSFFKRAEIFHEIQSRKLHRASHSSAEAYFKDKWNYSRSHGYRLAAAGKIIARLSPRGDAIKKLTSESHFRGLSVLSDEQQDEVIAMLEKWLEWTAQQEVSPGMVQSAVLLVKPPVAATEHEDIKSGKGREFARAADEIVARLPSSTPKEAREAIGEIVKKGMALAGPTRTTGIDWTDSTWNPLQGCSRASEGCRYCYAAKLVATRLAAVYPGLAEEQTGKDGRKEYVFTGKIMLLPEQLGEPLQNRSPRRYFVNSMSDLFHKDVPEAFIEAVFDVMEKAHWHRFQVLTKRPERMAEFTAKRYANKEPSANIWLGTTTEDQMAFDKRYPHLLKVKAAVRWLSIEPMIGKITFSSMDGIDWVVVGGESGSKRKMEKEWVVAIRDACKKAGVPFFFKQWGEYGEDGTKLKRKKKDGLTPAATLDGVTHVEYPKSKEGGKAEDAVPVVQGCEPAKAA